MMRTSLACLIVALMLTARIDAHFIWIVPGGAKAPSQVVFSDDLEPDDAVDINTIAGLKLFATTKAGKTVPVQATAGKNALMISLPEGARVVHGSIVYGMMTKNAVKPALLMYHPLAILGEPTGKATLTGEAAAIEIVPIAAAGKTAFRVFAAGQPAADAEVSVMLPNKERKKVKTNPQGETEAFSELGRYAAWAKVVATKAGEHNGKKYEEIRHYGTVVVDVRTTPSTRAVLPDMPQAVSSFGAIACDGYAYVYGGHAGKTHSYDTKTVSGAFHRLKLDGGAKWEELPPGPGVQGMNLATHAGKIYRVGGMQPRNAPGEKANNHSLASAAVFDPATRKWTDLPDLPQGRSSHDVVVVGDLLMVVGGWEMLGGQKPRWCASAVMLDLAAKNPTWRSIDQPFQRRALTATPAGSKVYVLGGLDATGSTKNVVDIYDAATKSWSTGPAFPGEGAGFSPAACTLNGRVVLYTSEGRMLRLTADGNGWEQVGEANTRRMVARLLPMRSSVLLLGGASKAGNVATPEVISIAERGEPIARSSATGATP